MYAEISLLYVLLSITGFLFIAMTLIWALSIWIQNPTIIDVWWSAGQAITFSAYLVYLADFQSSKVSLDKSEIAIYILIGMICFWALRLSIFLLVTRVMKAHVDPRYANMEKRWNAQQQKVYLNRFFAFQFQSALQLVLLTPLIIATWMVAVEPTVVFEQNIGTLYIFPIICGISVIGQGLMDYQVYELGLRKQKAAKNGDESLKNAICKTGLWSVSRHPNYFFEMMIWFSFVGQIIAGLAGTVTGWTLYLRLILPVFCLIVMFVIFRFISGPLTEGLSLKKRPVVYGEYIRTVPMIFPFIKWPNFISNMELPERKNSGSVQESNPALEN